ncbi:MAG: zinc-ribbon domain-containing protein [Verrucomicrobiota bacterium]
MTPPDICPVCGAEVPSTAHACPECGADNTTGWNEDHAVYDGLNLPDDEFDYDEFINKEFNGKGKPVKKRLQWLCIIGFALVLIALIIFLRISDCGFAT